MYTLDDVRSELAKVTGPRHPVPDWLPGMAGVRQREDAKREKFLRQIREMVSIIDAMTAEERSNPSRFVNRDRLQEIANSAGVDAMDVQWVVRQYEQFVSRIKRI